MRSTLIKTNTWNQRYYRDSFPGKVMRKRKKCSVKTCNRILWFRCLLCEFLVISFSFYFGQLLFLVIYDSILEICDLMTREAVICFPFRKGCYGHLCIYGRHIITHELITFWISFNFYFVVGIVFTLFTNFLRFRLRQEFKAVFPYIRTFQSRDWIMFNLMVLKSLIYV